MYRNKSSWHQLCHSSSLISIFYIYINFILKEKRNKVREKEKESKKYIENTSMNKKIQLCTGIKAAGINYAAVRTYINFLYI